MGCYEPRPVWSDSSKDESDHHALMYVVTELRRIDAHVGSGHAAARYHAQDSSTIIVLKMRQRPNPAHGADDHAVYCSCQKQTSYTFRGYVLRRDVTKFQGCTLLAV